MTASADIERRLDRYLAEGPAHVPDRVVDVALARVAQTSQRRALSVPWRYYSTASFLKPALAGAAVMAALIFGGWIVARQPTEVRGPAVASPKPTDVRGPAVASPQPTASAAASAAPTPMPEPSASLAFTETSDWTAFTSNRYGYEAAHPPTWRAIEAIEPLGQSPSKSGYISWDHFSGDGLVLYAYSFDLPEGMTTFDWIRATMEGCSPDFHSARPVLVGGHPAHVFVRDHCSDAQAFVAVGERVHVFVATYLNPSSEEARLAAPTTQVALLDLFLSTVRFVTVDITDTSTWTAFKGGYPYRLAYPPGWIATAATTQWGTDRAIDLHPDHTSWDYFLGEDQLVYSFSAPLAAEKSVDDWILENQEGCTFQLEEAQPIVVDGVPGKVIVRPGCSDATAFVRIDGRLFVFVATYPSPISAQDRLDAATTEKALLDLFLSTVRF